MATVAQINGRQSTIVAITNDTGRCSVADLAERFCVTAETIRRDLKSLEAKGLLRRVHGGAVAGVLTTQSDLVATDDDDELPIQQSQRRKNLIAQKAIELIPSPTAAIFIDAGSTTEAFASTLAHNYRGQNWSIVTNSPNVAHTVATAGVPQVTILGGTIKARTQAVVGPNAVETLRSLRADIAFMGTTALSLTHGLTTSDPREAAVKETMISQSNHVVVLCDSTKLGRESNVQFAKLSDIDVVVSDRNVPPDFTSKLHPYDTSMVIP